ncbi:hypothetical protein LUX57_27595 [Actinomadura madurae]|nr:hypothetical protein [Actinomadura madurae]
MTASCTLRHSADDPRLGEPLCPDCYDYTGSVLFNAMAPELWRRSTLALRRYLAKSAGLTQKEFRETLAVSFAKVAEYQRRGVVHFHAVIRFDGPNGPTTPPARLGNRPAPGRRRQARRPAPSRSPLQKPLTSRHDRCPGVRKSTSGPSPHRARSPNRPWRATSPSTQPKPPNASAPSTDAYTPLTTWTSSRSRRTPGGS